MRWPTLLVGHTNHAVGYSSGTWKIMTAPFHVLREEQNNIVRCYSMTYANIVIILLHL